MSSKITIKHDTMDLSKVPRHSVDEQDSSLQPTPASQPAGPTQRRMINKYAHRQRVSTFPQPSNPPTAQPQPVSSDIPANSTETTIAKTEEISPPFQSSTITSSPRQHRLDPSHGLNSSQYSASMNDSDINSSFALNQSNQLPPPTNLAASYFYEQFSAMQLKHQQLLNQQQSLNSKMDDFATRNSAFNTNLKQTRQQFSTLLQDTNQHLTRIQSLHTTLSPTSASSYFSTGSSLTHSVSLPQPYLDQLKLDINTIKTILDSHKVKGEGTTFFPTQPLSQNSSENIFGDDETLLTTPTKQTTILQPKPTHGLNNDDDDDIPFDLSSLQDQCKVGFSPNRHRASPSIPQTEKETHPPTQAATDSTSPLKPMTKRPMIANRFRNPGTLTSPITAQFLQQNNPECEAKGELQVHLDPSASQSDMADSNSNGLGLLDLTSPVNSISELAPNHHRPPTPFRPTPTPTPNNTPVKPPQSTSVSGNANNQDDEDENLFDDEDACLVVKPQTTQPPPSTAVKRSSKYGNNAQDDEDLFGDEDGCLVVAKKQPIRAPPPISEYGQKPQADDEDLFGDEDACLLVKPPLPKAAQKLPTPPQDDDEDLFGDEDACLVVAKQLPPLVDSNIISQSSSDLMNSLSLPPSQDSFNQHENNAYNDYLYRLQHPPDLRYEEANDEFLAAAEHFETHYEPQSISLTLTTSDEEHEPQSNSEGYPEPEKEPQQDSNSNPSKGKRRLKWFSSSSPADAQSATRRRSMKVTTLEFEPQEYEEIPYIRDHVERVDGELPSHFNVKIPDDYYDSDRDTPDSAPIHSTFHYFETTQKNTANNTTDPLPIAEANSQWDCSYQRRFKPSPYDFYNSNENEDDSDPYGRGFPGQFGGYGHGYGGDDGDRSPHSSDDDLDHYHGYPYGSSSNTSGSYVIEPVPPDDDDEDVSAEELSKRLSKYFN